MKLWLDDQIDDPETPDRHPPPGYLGVRSALQACRLLRNYRVSHVDFDHDLGPGPSGYTVARFIEKRAFLGLQVPTHYAIHSANPVGRANIERAMTSANRFWALREPTITCRSPGPTFATNVAFRKSARYSMAPSMPCPTGNRHDW